jgi:hypothetical protein
MPKNSYLGVRIVTQPLNAIAAYTFAFNVGVATCTSIPGGGTTLTLPDDPSDGDWYEWANPDDSASVADPVVVGLSLAAIAAGVTIQGASAQRFSTPGTSGRATFDDASDTWWIASAQFAATPTAGSFPVRETTSHATAYATATGVPIAVSFAGVPTANVTLGSPLVTMSAPITANVGDLVFFGGDQAYEVAAPAPVASAALVLASNYLQASNPAIATTTVPIGEDFIELPTITGLPATGWKLNLQGVLQLDNTNAAVRQVFIYPSGSSEFGQTAFGAENLTVQNAPTVVPFNFELVALSPSPTTFKPRIFLVAQAGAAGDVTTGSIANSFLSATQTG